LDKLKELFDDINSDNYVKDKLTSLFGEENILAGFIIIVNYFLILKGQLFAKVSN